MSDWDVVHQLAAEFQKIQASTGTQKLSERNCVEVVTKLVSMGLLDTLYTLDGKEYITPQHLEREIRDELLVNKGRLNIVDLQQILNVDLSHIEAKVGDILKRDRNIVLLQGELINKVYINALCEEVNETLQEVGQVSIADLSRNFGLPNDFLIEHLEASIGTRIKGQLDKTGSGAIYTDAFVARYVSRIRGLFSGMTRPTAIGPLIIQGSFQQKLFLTVLHELISKGTLPGSLHGHMEKAVYIPHVYTRMQNKWADSFLASNGYLEYDALSRLGIESPEVFVSQRYSSRGDVVELVSCVVGEGVMTELGARLEEALATEGWVDVLTLLPSPCTVDDAELLVQKKYLSDPALKVSGGFLIKKSFIQLCLDHFKQLVQEKAQKVVTTDAVRVSEMIQYSFETEDTPKASSRKKGRDKKGKGKKSGESLEAIQRASSSKSGLQFMSEEEINAELLRKFPDCLENVTKEIAADIFHPLLAAYQEELKTCLATLGQSSSASQQRKKHANTQERVQGLWTNAKLFGRAIELFDGDSVVQLSKYLLKTVCSDMMNMILLYVSDSDSQSALQPEEITPKNRSRLISSLSDHPREIMSELDKSLGGKDVEKFFELFDNVCGEDFCGIMLKKVDKKKERQLLFSHQQSLLGNLRDEVEPAMSLHLITVILFQQHTCQIVHIPGKLVPTVISFLAQHLDQSLFTKLAECQRLVSDQLRSVQDTSSDSPTPIDGDHSQNTDKLYSLLAELKDSLLNKSKGNVNEN